MGNGYLWLVNSNGVPYRVTASDKIEHISDAQWKPEPVLDSGKNLRVQQIVAAPHTAFALDNTGAVFQFVLTSYVTVRQQVEIYSNQRWYPVMGWSSRTLPTDRASFTNENGWRKSEELDGFKLKSDGWRWEEPWMVDLDARKCDKEGWEYAINFVGAVWKREKSVNSFVRRRKWKRYMRYTGLEKWIKLPTERKNFVELAIGGFDIFPDHQFLLFALSKGGNLFRRVGIHASNPDGDYWQEMPEIEANAEREELLRISCSAALGTLVVMTWNGRLFLRIGITRETPLGCLLVLTANTIRSPCSFRLYRNQIIMDYFRGCQAVDEAFRVRKQ
ncbi:hypothetical protein KIN20_024765 [Parelaphostrongylus tenuis]|uniref:Peroxin/Ferlin domain-containing protein n=1 Tax=Parelaphostrongylus tenuis TaxID=148309 RepID=A0AAD5MTZ4_PARTN|nr:hypothetical protein KIN20_024765 [Parelaphostrongylus tenuis]